MKTLLLGLIAFCSLANASRLVLCGGGELPAKAMRRLVDWSGGVNANILVISWATDDPEFSFKNFSAAVAPFKPAKVVAAPHRINFVQNKDLFLKQLREATGVFFTGGDQAFIMSTAKLSSDVLVAIRNKFAMGTVFGGSSAGTAVMPRIMYTGEGDFTVIDPKKVDMIEGLNFTPGILLDQHFLKRQRQNRLTSVLLRNEENVGIGIDEDNAITLVDGKYVEVVGPGQAIVFQRKSRQGFDMTLLYPGQAFTLFQKCCR